MGANPAQSHILDKPGSSPSFFDEEQQMEGCCKKERLPRGGETVSAVLSSLGELAALTGISRNAAHSANSVCHCGLQLFCKLGHHSIATPRRAEDLFPGVAYFELRPPSARHRVALNHNTKGDQRNIRAVINATLGFDRQGSKRDQR